MLRRERMLLGSRSALEPCPEPGVGVPPMLLPAPGDVDAPAPLPAEAAGVRSSTGAVLSGVGVLAQPARSAAKRALTSNLFMMSPSWFIRRDSVIGLR